MSKCEDCAKQGNCPLEGDWVIVCLLFKDDREKTYSEHTEHKRRSLFHQPNHAKYWKRQEREDNNNLA